MCVGRSLNSDHEFRLRDFAATKNDEVSELLEEPVQKLHKTEKKKKRCYDSQITQDFLALSTQWTKNALHQLNNYFKSLQKTPAYRILCHTTQPAHLVTSLAVLSIAFLCLPTQATVTTISPLWSLLYLGSFSVHFGAQIWMTFVSGLALYFSLPRHTFGSIQQVLFPKYFCLNSVLSLITLFIFFRAKNHELKTMEIGVQAVAMSLCFLTELVIFLYLTPPLLALISSKTKIEKEAGLGMEVGKFEYGKLSKCPHYVKIHKAFRKVHMSIAMGNMFTMACTMLHLYYLSSKLVGISL